MGVVIGRPDDQVVKVFLGNNLTRNTGHYKEPEENLSPEEKARQARIEKKKKEDEIIL